MRSSLRHIVSLVASYRKLLGDRFPAFALLGAAVLAGALLDAIGIALVMPLVATLQGEGLSESPLAFLIELLGPAPLTSIAIAVALVYLFKNALALFRIRMSLKVLYESWSDWVAATVANVLRAPVTAYESEKPGALLSVALTQSMESTIGLRQLLELGVSLSTLLATYVVLLVLSWKATLVLTVVLLGFGLLIVRPLTRAAHSAGTDLVRANKAASSTFLEILGGIRYVKAYGQEERFRDRMAQSLFDFRRALVSATWSGALVHPLVETAVVLLFCAVIVVLAAGSEDLSRELPLLAVLVAAAFRLFPILSGLGSQWVAFISKQPAAEAVLAAIEPRAAEPSGSRPFDSFEREVVFHRVGYTYTGRAPALHEASLVLPRGSRTALVGESGSGKSTVVALLLGFLVPERGRIEVDGTPLGELRLADWRKCLGYVGQEGFVFNATLAENVTLGRSDASDPRVSATLRATGLDEVVRELPQGLDTVVGERGVELSGGQRQRVALARAALLDPQILVLDEATSALDNEAAFKVMRGIQELLPKTTILAVAHRLGSTTGFDRIYVLRSGRIVEEGSHEELTALGGYYRQLYEHERGPSR